MGSSRHAWLLVCGWWLALVAAALAWRPLTAIDETRYATVAWEMWLSRDPVSLHLNGALYGDKPPLLFWLIGLGWALIGPNAWWPQLLTALFGLATLALLLRLARQLAPADDDIAALTVLITAGTLVWMAFTAALLFDLVLSFFVLLGVLAVVQATSSADRRWWLLLGLALGLGILTKGPVALLHVLPLALLAPWWRRTLLAQPATMAPQRWGRWYAGIVVAVLIAAAIALAWAVPAALSGGEAFQREMFWSQSADRIATTSHHLRPPWFYLAALLLLLLPWTLLPSVWRGVAALARVPATAPSGLRMAISWLVPVVLVLSVFRAKQPQYLLPEVPALAFIVACALRGRPAVRRWETSVISAALVLCTAALLVYVQRPGSGAPWWSAERGAIWLSAAVWLCVALAIAGLAAGPPVRAVALVGTGMVALVLGAYAGAGRVALRAYDVEPMARRLAVLQAQGCPIAHLGKYHGEYQFLGRLQQPLLVFERPQALQQWAAAHPDGAVVAYTRALPELASGARPEFTQRFRSGHLTLWRGDAFARLATDSLRPPDGSP
jgi:4-amino-4-deoxy-L-arabinose transferase-like glycosyltransferase